MSHLPGGLLGFPRTGHNIWGLVWDPQRPHRDPWLQRFILINCGKSVFEVLSVLHLFFVGSDLIIWTGQYVLMDMLEGWLEESGDVPFPRLDGCFASETILPGTQLGPICNSESEVSGDQVALLNGSHPICINFGRGEAKSLGSQLTRPSDIRGSLFWPLSNCCVCQSCVFYLCISVNDWLDWTDLSFHLIWLHPLRLCKFSPKNSYAACHSAPTSHAGGSVPSACPRGCGPWLPAMPDQGLAP